MCLWLFFLARFIYHDDSFCDASATTKGRGHSSDARLDLYGSFPALLPRVQFHGYVPELFGHPSVHR